MVWTQPKGSIQTPPPFPGCPTHRNALPPPCSTLSPTFPAPRNGLPQPNLAGRKPLGWTLGRRKPLVLALQCRTCAIKHIHARTRITGQIQVAESTQPCCSEHWVFTYLGLRLPKKRIVLSMKFIRISTPARPSASLSVSLSTIPCWDRWLTFQYLRLDSKWSTCQLARYKAVAILSESAIFQLGTFISDNDWKPRTEPLEITNQ